jgi:Cytochrome c biogenesis protein
MDFSLPVVFGAGVLSFLSPCVLPLVPPYLSYMGGTSFERLRDGDRDARRRAALTSLFFVAGFTVVFVALGATATAFGQAFRQVLPAMVPLAGIAVMAMGLHFLGVLRIPGMDRQFRSDGPARASGPAGGFLMGLAFALGWTPCIGPVLAAVLAVSSGRDTALEGAGLLAVYSLGLGLPFVLSGIAVGPFLAFFSGFRRNMGAVVKATGVLLVATGVLFVTGQMAAMSYWFLETFPALAALG